MKILYYQMPQDEPINSGGSHADELFNNLTQLGHTIVYINGHIHTVSNNNKTVLKLKRTTRRSIYQRIEVVLTKIAIRGEISILWMLLKEFVFLLRAIIIYFTVKPDVIYRRHSLFNFEYFLSLFLKLPTIQEVNGIIADESQINKTGNVFALSIIRFIERNSFPKSGNYIVVTKWLKEILENKHGIPKRNIVVIENGVNVDLFQPMDVREARLELDLIQGSEYICFIGSLTRWQGVEYLIKSIPVVLPRFPNTLFMVIGDGLMKQELVELAKNIGVASNVIFSEGSVPYRSVPLYINASDICVVTKKPLRSGYSPLKLYEYLACGKPVIASRVNGFELLEENTAGLLVDPRDSNEFGAAIIRLLENPQLRRYMGSKGRRYVLENRNWKSVASRVAGVCSQAIETQKLKSQGK